MLVINHLIMLFFVLIAGTGNIEYLNLRNIQNYSKTLKKSGQRREPAAAEENELCHSDEHFPRSSRSATIFTKGKEGSFAWSSASWAKVGGQETAKQRDGRDVPMQERRSPYTLRKILIEILNLRRQSWILWNIFSFLFRCVKWFFS